MYEPTIIHKIQANKLKILQKPTVREFVMTPATVTATGRNGNLPPRPDPAATVSLNNIDFEIKGQLDSTAIQMEHALTGQSNILL